ncbi:MAG: quaternary ammonium compound-resistance protein SugE [Gammaproteobacteria bacterium]|jgi:quaternary ammonium compound-resistance protein SugE
MAWIYLLAAGLLECIWHIALKESASFTQLVPSAVALIIGLISFGLLTVALNHIPVGTAYGVWTGIGASGVTILGIIYYGESASAARLICISMIVVGFIGLRFFADEG